VEFNEESNERDMIRIRLKKVAKKYIY